MLCRNEERPDNDERFIAILSSVSFIMLKKGDYIKAKAFAEQVNFKNRLNILHGPSQPNDDENYDHQYHHYNDQDYHIEN